MFARTNSFDIVPKAGLTVEVSVQIRSPRSWESSETE